MSGDSVPEPATHGMAAMTARAGAPAAAGWTAPATAPCAQCGIPPGPGPAGGEPCPNCGAAATRWVYTIGQLVPRFADLGVEKEVAQAGASASGGPVETDRLIELLEDPEFSYLARQLCWVLRTPDGDAFVIACHDDSHAQRLVAAMPRADTSEDTIQAVIGAAAPPGFSSGPCAPTGLPEVTVAHHLTFTFADFVARLDEEQRGAGEQRPGEPDAFRVVARDLFARLTRRSGNRGLLDEHRALNYLALRYPALYRVAADAHRDDKLLMDVNARRHAGADRVLVAVRLVFRGRRTDLLERYQCLVDVSDRFPFLSAPLSQVYD